MWKWLVPLVLFASPVMAQQQATAYEALQVIGTQVNRSYLSRVISVSGVNGDPQPTSWRVVVADRSAPGGVREFDVSRGRVTAQRTPEEAGGGTPINTARLNLDSSGAFSVASYTADKSHTNFSFVSYTLRSNNSGYPYWIVTLQNEARRPIGTIHIGANRGNVTRVEGMFRGRDVAQAEPDRAVQRRRPEPTYYDETEEIDEGDGDENIVKAEIKKAFRRTKEDARRAFERVRRSFRDYADRW